MSHMILTLLGCFGGAPYFPELGSNGLIWRDTGVTTREDTAPSGDSTPDSEPDSPPDDSDPLPAETVVVVAGTASAPCTEGDPSRQVTIGLQNDLPQVLALYRMMGDCTRAWVTQLPPGQRTPFMANIGSVWTVTTSDGATNVFDLHIGSADDEVSIP